LCCIQLPLPAKTDTERETLREREREKEIVFRERERKNTKQRTSITWHIGKQRKEQTRSEKTEYLLCFSFFLCQKHQIFIFSKVPSFKFAIFFAPSIHSDSSASGFLRFCSKNHFLNMAFGF
jgi:hypothetical protein